MAIKDTDQPAGKDKRLSKLTEICLSLPEGAVEYMGDHAQYLIRKKKFAYFLNDHHGDGIVAVACKVLPGDNERLIAADPELFYMPAYIGPRGWVAFRLDVGRIDWQEVRDLVTGSYQLVAPGKLASLV